MVDYVTRGRKVQATDLPTRLQFRHVQITVDARFNAYALWRHVMGFFSADPKQYVRDGFELTHTLIREFTLPGWSNGRPDVSDDNQRYLDEVFDAFTAGSNAEAKKKGAETIKYHPEYWPYVERAITDCALRREALTCEGPWEIQLSTILKAWASGLNPWAMIDIAGLLFEHDHAKFAQQALKICSLFPRYWNSKPAREVEFTTLRACFINTV
jgi:hypothetical protein